MTKYEKNIVAYEAILIHTSVKLVTHFRSAPSGAERILIHTSVKLVTGNDIAGLQEPEDFNPHEREARDLTGKSTWLTAAILIHTSVKLVT